MGWLGHVCTASTVESYRLAMMYTAWTMPGI